MAALLDQNIAKIAQHSCLGFVAQRLVAEDENALLVKQVTQRLLLRLVEVARKIEIDLAADRWQRSVFEGMGAHFGFSESGDAVRACPICLS